MPSVLVFTTRNLAMSRYDVNCESIRKVPISDKLCIPDNIVILF